MSDWRGDSKTGSRKRGEDLFARAVARVRERVTGTLEVMERFDALLEQCSPRASRYDVEQLATYLEAMPTIPGQQMRLVAMLAAHEQRARALEVLSNWEVSGEDKELRLFRDVALAHMRSEDMSPAREGNRGDDLRDAA